MGVVMGPSPFNLLAILAKHAVFGESENIPIP